MHKKLETSFITIDNELSDDMISIIGGHKITPFMELFWQQQKKLFSRSAKGAGFHPAVIRYCLSLYLKSPYDEIHESGMLRLPSSRTLCDYANTIPPKPGLNKLVLEDLKKSTKDYSDVQRHIGNMLDEMKIQANLVFKKHSGELIGYLDLGNPDINLLKCSIKRSWRHT